MPLPLLRAFGRGQGLSRHSVLAAADEGGLESNLTLFQIFPEFPMISHFSITFSHVFPVMYRYVPLRTVTEMRLPLSALPTPVSDALSSILVTL